MAEPNNTRHFQLGVSYEARNDIGELVRIKRDER